MPTLPLSEVRPGMVLGSDAESPDGNYRLSAGLRLRESDLRLLRSWRRRDIDIEDEAPAGTPVAEPGDGQARIRERFAHLPDDPIVNALLHLALERADSLPPPAPCLAGIGDIPPAGTLKPERILANDPVLVSLPEVFMRIREVLSDPDSTVDEAAAVIGKDPSLTAKLLKLVNSAFYARTMRVSGGLPPGPVDSLNRAVMLLGLNQLSTLAMGVSVLPLFKDIPPECIDMGQFWRHSVAVGLTAKLLALRLGDPSPERFFVAGLLHDIGRLVLFKQHSREAGAALSRAAATGRLLVEVEQELFGFDHSRLGGMLLRKWRFPESLEQAVWLHHDPMAAEHPLEPALVGVADMVACAALPGGSGERLVPRLQPEAWRLAGVRPDELPELVEAAETHLDVVCAMFG